MVDIKSVAKIIQKIIMLKYSHILEKLRNKIILKYKILIKIYLKGTRKRIYFGT